MSPSSLRDKRIRAGIRALVGAVLLVATAACGALGGDSDRASGPHPEVRVTKMPILDSATLSVAIEQGFFADANIAVTPVPATSGQFGIDKLVSGEADIAYAGDVAIVSAIANGRLDLQVIAQAAMAGPKSMWIMARKGGPVVGVADLAGKKIAHNGPGGVSDLLTRTVLATNGVDTSKIQWATVNFPDVAQRIAARDIDAALLTEPYVIQAGRLGVGPVIDAVVGGGFEQGIPTGSYVVLKEWARNHPAQIAAFQRGLRRGATEATARPVLVERIAVRDMKVDPGDAALMKQPVYPVGLSAVQLQRWPDLMHKLGVIDTPVQMADRIIAPPPGN